MKIGICSGSVARNAQTFVEQFSRSESSRNTFGDEGFIGEGFALVNREGLEVLRSNRSWYTRGNGERDGMKA